MQKSSAGSRNLLCGVDSLKMFEALKGHTQMALINSWMCPWLIANYGKSFADQDNAEPALEMLSDVIVRNQIGCYNAAKFEQTCDGNRTELLSITKFVLTRLGMYFLLQCAHYHNSDHICDRKINGETSCSLARGPDPSVLQRSTARNASADC